MRRCRSEDHVLDTADREPEMAVIASTGVPRAEHRIAVDDDLGWAWRLTRRNRASGEDCPAGHSMHSVDNAINPNPQRHLGIADAEALNVKADLPGLRAIDPEGQSGLRCRSCPAVGDAAVTVFK